MQQFHIGFQWLIYQGFLVEDGFHRHCTSDHQPIKNHRITKELLQVVSDIQQYVRNNDWDKFISWIESDTSLDPVMDRIIPMIEHHPRGQKALENRMKFFYRFKPLLRDETPRIPQTTSLMPIYPQVRERRLSEEFELLEKEEEQE